MSSRSWRCAWSPQEGVASAPPINHHTTTTDTWVYVPHRGTTTGTYALPEPGGSLASLIPHPLLNRTDRKSVDPLLLLGARQSSATRAIQPTQSLAPCQSGWDRMRQPTSGELSATLNTNLLWLLSAQSLRRRAVTEHNAYTTWRTWLAASVLVGGRHRTGQQCGGRD